MDDALSSVYATLIPVAEELRGQRVVLTRLRVSDAADLFEALEDSRERLAPWLHFPDPLQTVEATRDWLIHLESRWLLRQALSFAIRHGRTHEYLGGIELHTIMWDRRFFALGYWLRSGAEGHGYMSESVQI